MICRVHKPVNTPKVSDNKGTCRQLVEYLCKENDDKNRPYFDSFFSDNQDLVSPDKVLSIIDANKKTLKKKDDKFYMLTINPSQEELKSLIKDVTGREVHVFSELAPKEQERVIAELKVLARGCMDDYALNFYREKIKSGSDLVWFGRVETERHYSGTDDVVKEGHAKSGDLKPGLQLHVHIIVSRMDKTQTVSISPLSKSRGKRQKLDGKEVVYGFDRMQWSTRCYARFCSMYRYIPAYVSQKKEWEEYMAKVRKYNNMIDACKRMCLGGELHYEQQTIKFFLSSIRFILNYKHSFLDFKKDKSSNLELEM